ncbi:MAG: beta-ketoacyl synthase N-terminal-like domain-containing protein [Polyangiaceae bacterium]
MSRFEPVAIVGRACVLPGALDPEALWQAVIAGQDLTTPVPRDRWGLPPSSVRTTADEAAQDRTWCERGGYVQGFEACFDAEGFAIPAAQVAALDPLVQWLLHAGREALVGIADRRRAGAVIGNLSFPSSSMARFAERQWLGDTLADAADLAPTSAVNRFMSGLPAHLVAQALGLGGPAFCLDAACASSLVALKLACDRLHDREADVMLAGAVCRADDLFIHVGFCALSAMSRSGQSRPFHRDADGLVPAEGAGLVALMRLEDAEAMGLPILGVIRGIGLANDGRGQGLLAPSSAGQQRAIARAYEVAGLTPGDVDYVECHATGTPTGDHTELESMQAVFGDRALPIGSLKSNLGHAITAAGIAGLLKLLAAFEAEQLPPTIHVDPASEVKALADGPFRILREPEPWARPEGRGRRAGLSAFGFGGNDAHVIIEQHRPANQEPSGQTATSPRWAEVAVVGVATRVLAEGDTVDVPLQGLRFPPKDLERTLPQQLLLLALAQQALEGLDLPGTRTGVFAGMGCDPEIARYGARWRMRTWARRWGVAEPSFVEAAEEAFVAGLVAAGVVGTMPNIVANRINSAFDFGGGSASISSEELSGLRALRLAQRAVATGELDAAVVGAADLSREPVHEAALRALGITRPSEDAGVVFVLQRVADAERAGHPILARLHTRPQAEVEPLPLHEARAHAAAGIVELAEAIQAGPPGRRLSLELQALGGQRDAVTLELGQPPAPKPVPTAPHLHFAAHPPRVALPSLPPVMHRSPVPPLAPPAGVEILPAAPLLEARAPSVLGDAPPRAATTSPAPFATTSATASANPGLAGAPPMPATHGASVAVTPYAQHLATAAPAPLGAAPSGQHPAPAGAAATPSAAAPHGLTGAPLPGAPFHDAPSAPLPGAAGAAFPAAFPDAPLAGASLPATAQAAGLATVPAAPRRMASLAAQHRAFLAQQQALHDQFLALRARSQRAFVEAFAHRRPVTAVTPSAAPHVPAVTPSAAPHVSAVTSAAAPFQAPAAHSPAPTAHSPVAQAHSPAPTAHSPAPAAHAPAPTPHSPAPTVGDHAPTPNSPAAEAPRPTAPPLPPKGPTLDREGLMIHAGGTISTIFGAQFAPQDEHPRQVRMPLPPLLLADRMTGLDAEPASMGTGTIWTETDVTEDSWYLHRGRMPAGLMIESGQADLMLISYLGADLVNRGERVYRLLGCELTYHGALPKPGDTLAYDIHVDGHAAHGDVRLFFFHYDCHVAGEPRLTVRGGQAGFFTDEELADSAGILWRAETGEHTPTPRLDPPPRVSEHRAFTADQVRAFAAGRTRDCFGKGFEKTCAHTDTPRISGGRMLFFDEVTHFEPEGGPWGRGYLRAVDTITPDDWFFEGHFKNDPCMPGTLMFEGCLQTMAFYLAALGFTIERDGYRFEPVPEETYKMRCRGQVIPSSKELVYEVFIEEVIDGPTPTIYADLLCTVDGLGAFHCRRMGLRLVPDWPLERILAERPELLSTRPGEVATVDGFAFDHHSLLACAWGRPSTAFGPIYARFDSARTVARLPGPPYHFMTRIEAIDGQIGHLEPGQTVEVAYDVPEDAWYFDANGARTMPYCVLLEAALQPCGWLASFVGSTLSTDIDLAFRNLDGTGRLVAEVLPQSGTLRTRATIKSISGAAGMIIEAFDVQCFLGDTLIYEMDTVFGFFPKEALDAQAGLEIPADEAGVLTAPSERVVDLAARPARYFAGGAALPPAELLMIGAVDGIWPDGGVAGLGRYRARTPVDPGHWYMKAHFFQDPVQPGSLGIEAMIHLLQFAMLDRGLDEGIADARFEPLALDEALTWKYRGQVRVQNEVVHCVIDILEEGRDERGAYAKAKASLWVDGMRIYEAKNLGMRIVSGGVPPKKPRAEEGEELLEPSRDTWLADHCPTYAVPALPLMSMLDRLAGAAQAARPDEKVVAIEELAVLRWLPVQGPTRLRTEVQEEASGDLQVTLLTWREAARAELSRFEPVARARVRTAADYPASPVAFPTLAAGEHVADPYASGELFHGPAFQKLRALRRTAHGASAVLDARPGEVPFGTLNQVLLDAATHPIPHDALHRWTDAVGEDEVAYPYRVTSFTLHAPPPREGEVRAEVRFGGVEALEGRRFPRFEVQLLVGSQVWAAFTLVEVVLPKGPLGSVPPNDRLAFLRDRLPVPGMALSRHRDGTTRLSPAEVRASNWLPGTLEALYDVHGPLETLTEAIAAKDHVALEAGVHPSTVRISGASERRIGVSAAQPLTLHRLRVEVGDDEVVVTGGAERGLDLLPVRTYWSEHFGDVGRWPVEDLYYGLIERFVRRVHVEDPEAFEAVRGRSVLYLANHQTAIESLLFSILVSGLTEVPTVTLAKIEHQTTWLGLLIQHCFSYPGVIDPQVITYFDRSDPTALSAIIGDLAAEMMGPGKSVMVHIEGTRSHECRTPVQKMTSAFIDMALATRAPIVPVRFVGGLPAEPLKKRVEFPLAMGQQDIHLGRPIWPETFEALGYKDRKPLVIDGINRLGPDNAVEAPFPGDAAFAAEVAARVARTGATEEHATCLEVLRERKQRHPMVQRLLAGDVEGVLPLGDTPEDRWLAELAHRLYGPDGARIEGA